MRTLLVAGLSPIIAAVASCSMNEPPPVEPDASPFDAAPDATKTPDAAMEAGPDVQMEAEVDAGSDAGLDAMEAAAPVHAYVANFNNNQSGGTVTMHDLPISMVAPKVTLGSNNGLTAPVQVLFAPSDATHVWVIDRAGQQAAKYALPLSSNSMPALTVSTSYEPTGGAFDSQGNLWVGGIGGNVEKYAAPITNGAMPSVAFTTASGFPMGFALDAKDNLYVGLYAAYGIERYEAPITSQSTPAFTITMSSSVTGLAFDPSGNLFASLEQGSIAIFNAPLSQNSQAASTIGNVGLPQAGTFAPNKDFVFTSNSLGLLDLPAPNYGSATTLLPQGQYGMNGAHGVALGP